MIEKSTRENRALLLTANGVGAIAVIRIVGPGTHGFLKSSFSQNLTSARCVHGELRDASGKVIDDPLIVFDAEKKSADINLHGGPWVIAATFELLRESGFEIIESSAAALENLSAVDGESPLEFEMLRHLPLAITDRAVETLLDQPRRWKSLLSSSPDAEEVKVIADDRSLWWQLHPPRVAIVGNANVGKSTLANQLFEQSRSITANVPGTTRDWVEELTIVDDFAIHLIDTPGLRESEDAIEQAAIARARDEIRTADMRILMLDRSARIEPQMQLSVDFPDALRVANKSDCSPAWNASSQNAIEISAGKGTGIEQLRRAIVERFLGSSNVSSPCWWTLDQQNLLRRAASDVSLLASFR